MSVRQEDPVPGFFAGNDGGVTDLQVIEVKQSSMKNEFAPIVVNDLPRLTEFNLLQYENE